MIEFHGVVVRYPHREDPALNAVSLLATRKRITAVVGPTTPKGTVLKSLEATWAENPDMNHNNNTGVAIVTVT